MIRLLIDGDILCYKTASACDGRSYFIRYSKDGEEQTVYQKYKRDAEKSLALLEQEGYEILEGPTITYAPSDLTFAILELEKHIKDLEDNIRKYEAGPFSLHFFLSRGGSFRNEVYPGYKKNREDMRRPEHLEALKDYLVEKRGAVCKEGLYEADDLMAMNQGEDSIICSIDKDLLQVPGRHYNWMHDEYKEVTKEEGLRSLYKQMLTGDTSDGIPGIKGIGPKTADKLLDSCVSEFMMYYTVLKVYIEDRVYEDGESTEEFHQRVIEELRMAASLLYLLRSEEDYWEAPNENTGRMSVEA